MLHTQFPSPPLYLNASTNFDAQNGSTAILRPTRLDKVRWSACFSTDWRTGPAEPLSWKTPRFFLTFTGNGVLRKRQRAVIAFLAMCTVLFGSPAAVFRGA
ncbi:hypothetical protein CTAM01_02978 [Colletotrichum tamarilloi]|uniref:Uncharacterized protein n=1 Tax=Colletotrichum tamarilloi TaxID=1209934 RepID=A0ABQ9RLM7_9PEZI|nr:uncharacterized protein CTAM01_02978 [Colletotrichum tamarilloi]KAK1506646.1 hypothetical protein CTAM01_02978 [Colletotrichum tamarilloi]